MRVQAGLWGGLWYVGKGRSGAGKAGQGWSRGGSAICRSLWWMTGVWMSVYVRERERERESKREGCFFFLSALSYSLSLQAGRAGLSERRRETQTRADQSAAQQLHKDKKGKEFARRRLRERKQPFFYISRNCGGDQKIRKKEKRGVVFFRTRRTILAFVFSNLFIFTRYFY